MARHPSLDAATVAHLDKVDDEFNDQIERAAGVLNRVLKDDKEHPMVAIGKARQMADALVAIENGTFDESGRKAALDGKPVLALGAAPIATTMSADDDAIAKLKQLAVLTHVSLDDFAVMAERLFQPLTSVSGDQLRARAACMQMVAEGTLRVKEDGSPEILDKVARLESDLAAFKPAIDALRGVDRTEQAKRLKGINKVADGTTSVKADGSVETTVTGVPQGDHDAVKADLDAANAALDDVKSHISDGRLSGTPKLNFGALKRETKDRLNG